MAGVPLQRSLTVNVVFGVVVLGFVLLVISLVVSGRISKLIARDLTVRALREAELSGADLFEPIESITEVAEAWADEGWFETAETETLIRAVRGIVGGTDTGIVGVHIGTADGAEVFVMSTQEGDVALLTDPGDPDTVKRLFFAGGAPPRVSVVPNPFPEMRDRAWFADAVAEQQRNPGSSVSERRVVSQLGTLPGGGLQGVTVSVAVGSGDGTPVVIAYDVLASRIFGFFSGIRIRESGEVSIFALDETTDEFLHFAPDPDNPGVFVADGLGSDPGPCEAFVRTVSETPDDLFVRKFSYAGEDWWGAIEASDGGQEREIWFAAAVPEDELLGITDPLIYIVVSTLIVVVLASLRAFSLSVRYAGPVQALVAQSERMARLDFNEGDPIRSGIRELDQLARAQDRTCGVLANFTAMDHEVRIARQIREFDQRAQSAAAGRHEIAVTFSEGLRPACELAVCVDVVEDPGGAVRSLVPAGSGHRTLALQLSAPTTALDGAMLVREFTAAFRQSARHCDDPAMVLLDLDRYCRECYPDLGLVSACCIAFGPDNESIEIAAAGEPVVFIAAPDGPETLRLSGPSLGRMTDVLTLARRTLTLPLNAVLLACPRRIVEALRSDRTPLGIETLATHITDALDDDRSLDEILGTARSAIRRDLGRDRFEVDLATVVLRRKPIAGASKRDSA